MEEVVVETEFWKIIKLFNVTLFYSFPYSWKLFFAMILYSLVFKTIWERFESEKMIKGDKHKD